MEPKHPEPTLLPPASSRPAQRDAALREVRARIGRALELAARLEAEVWEGPWQQARAERSVVTRLVGELSGAADALARLTPPGGERPRRREPRERRQPFLHEWL